jgi:hypothetical protein
MESRLHSRARKQIQFLRLTMEPILFACLLIFLHFIDVVLHALMKNWVYVVPEVARAYVRTFGLCQLATR